MTTNILDLFIDTWTITPLSVKCHKAQKKVERNHLLIIIKKINRHKGSKKIVGANSLALFDLSGIKVHDRDGPIKTRII